MPETAPVEHDWLVVLSVSTTALALTIAVRTGDDLDLKLHRRQEIRLYDLAEPARAEKLNTFISTCCEAAGLAAIHSLFLCHSEDDLQCANGRGYAEMGEDIVLQASERRMALHRATVQSLPEDRVVLATLPLRWSVMGPAGDREVDDPCGQRGSRITCDVLLIHGRETTTKWVVDCLADRGVRVESHIAAPVAAYRTLAGDFPKTNGVVVIDWGATTTTVLVHRKGRLVHLETHPFGGDDVTKAIQQELACSWDDAQRYKEEIDLDHHAQPTDHEGQTWLFTDVQERQRTLVPAARVAHGLLSDFLKKAAAGLRANQLVAQRGRVVCVGRAAALTGLASLAGGCLSLPHYLGSGRSDRAAGDELTDLQVTGLLMIAGEYRTQTLQDRSQTGIRQVSSLARRTWQWLVTELG
jgi:cell division protein FtsA